MLNTYSIWVLGVITLVNCGSNYNTGYTAGSAVGGFSSASLNDFNPVLLQGSQRGFPGIRARINQRAFQYASGMIGDLLNQEIKKARIPPISQCIPQVQGCVQIYNLYVSRYRCPRRVVLYPAPPNRVVLQVQNVDIGVTGNLGGQIVVLLPIALTGIVQLNIHQATITVDLAIERGAHGPYVRVMSCNVQIGYADAYIENGGLIGDIINSQFRSKISGMVKKMIPGQVCGQIPSIVNEKINGKLSGLPQSIGVSQMIAMFGGALGLGGASGGPTPQFCASQCGGASGASGLASQGPIAQSNGPAPAPQIPTSAYSEGKRALARGTSQSAHYSTNQSPAVVHHLTPLRQPTAKALRRYRAVNYKQGRVLYVPVSRAKRQAVQHRIVRVVAQSMLPPSGRVVRHSSANAYQSPSQYTAGRALAVSAPRIPPPPVLSPQAQHFAPPPSNPCAQCPPSSAAAPTDPQSFIRLLTTQLDLRKLDDLYLSLQLLNTHATSNDFTVDLSGEFSPYGRGGSPFGAFPTQFPGAFDNHMAEFIVTDYTVNTLFYHMHRKQFLNFRVGPDVPTLGELLKTTCGDDDEDLFEATDIELDEEEFLRRRRLALSASKTYRLRRASKDRKRRQGDLGSLADLGICLGDILPAVREEHPNQKIAVVIHTVRAPSVILSQSQGGSAILDLLADADLYIDGTNTRVGTITIASTLIVAVQIHGNRITGNAQITNLKLTERGTLLGLPQDALDNVANLGKELLQKVANDALAKGIVLNIPTGGLGGLPISIVNPNVRIIEHGLYIATDIIVSPSLLGAVGGC